MKNIAVSLSFIILLAFNPTVFAQEKSEYEQMQDNLKELAVPLAEIHILEKNCYFSLEDLDKEVALFKTKRVLEHNYWSASCGMEGASAQEFIDDAITNAQKNEPMLTYGDYLKECPKRIQSIQKNAESILRNPAPKCEDEASGI